MPGLADLLPKIETEHTRSEPGLSSVIIAVPEETHIEKAESGLSDLLTINHEASGLGALRN